MAGRAGSAKASFAARSTSVRAYEPGKPVEEVQRELGLERVVKLASNEGPFPPFPAALEAIERDRPRAEPLPGRGLLPVARRACRAPRRPLRGGRGRSGRGRADRLRLAGDARSRRRDGLRLAVVRELRDRRAEARGRAEDRSARRPPLRRRRDPRRDRPEDQARLPLQSEQPDRDDEHARRARLVLRPGAGPRPDRARPGLLRVPRRSRVSGRRSRSTRRPGTPSSSCARSRRCTAWPGCGSATASAPRSS